MSIDDHRKTPNLSLEQYVKNCQLRLAAELAVRRSIYLDLKFWIALRKVENGESDDLATKKLLWLLRSLVASGKVFCPISDSTFLEIFKQSDPVTRRATIALVDELSLGVSLIPNELRMNTEIAHFMHSALNTTPTHPLQYLVWTKLSYVMGYTHPNTAAWGPAEGLAIQKAFVDHMWSISLSKMEEYLGDKMNLAMPFKSTASKLNESNKVHAAELRSFAQTYQVELDGLLDLCADVAAEVLSEFSRAHIGTRSLPGSEDWKKLKNSCFGLLRASFQKDSTKAALRSIHIQASLHACVRWDKTRMFKENDFMDFQHAAAGIGYCNAFFTERSLSSMIKRSDVALDTRYTCHVGVTIDDAITYIEKTF